ncbi:MAG: hypothetical protein GY938_26905 [Ketobacter sp.]|nr:hypothetical protein [Ketobacter sp.]
MSNSVWSQKGATLSDKSARKEFGLTQEEIIEAINRGKLQYCNSSIHGNSFFRLVRNEVEALVNEKYGKNYLKNKKLKKELADVNKELKRLKTELASLGQRKIELLQHIDE